MLAATTEERRCVWDYDQATLWGTSADASPFRRPYLGLRTCFDPKCDVTDRNTFPPPAILVRLQRELNRTNEPSPLIYKPPSLFFSSPPSSLPLSSPLPVFQDVWTRRLTRSFSYLHSLSLGLGCTRRHPHQPWLCLWVTERCVFPFHGLGCPRSYMLC